MGLDEVGFGILMTAMAVGSLVGSLTVERAERRLGRSRLLTTAVVISAVTVAVPGVTANAWIVGASFAISGVGVVMWNVVTVSLRQRIVPDGLLGRVNASYRLLAWGSQPIGALVGGLVGELLGLEAVFLVAGAATAVLVLGSRIVTDAAIVAAEREGDAAREGVADGAARADAAHRDDAPAVR
jgi:MFS family permease